MFLFRVKNIFASRTQILRPKHMFPSLATPGNITRNIVSATMFPNLARPLNSIIGNRRRRLTTETGDVTFLRRRNCECTRRCHLALCRSWERDYCFLRRMLFPIQNSGLNFCIWAAVISRSMSPIERKTLSMISYLYNNRSLKKNMNTPAFFFFFLSSSGDTNCG